MFFLFFVYKALTDLCHVQFAANGDDTSQLATDELDHEIWDSATGHFFLCIVNRSSLPTTSNILNLFFSYFTS